jgi:hypothetical protein
VATFVLFLPRHDQGIPVRLTVPLLDPPAPVRVEALLRPEPAWTVDALSPALSCLDLPAQRAAMGTHRFVDAGFQFVLRRWPMDDEAAVFAQAIDEGGMSPEAFLSELLGSRERADLGPDLASPWDATFPFAPVPAKERA